MKALLQRVDHAIVRVDGEVVGRCGMGLLVLLGVVLDDNSAVAERLARRVAKFRCFGDEKDRMNLSAQDVAAQALVISQVTLAHTSRKGNRPSFDLAAPPQIANSLYLEFAVALESHGLPTQRGRFGARMSVESVNNGPVTFLLDEVPAALQ